MVVNVRLMGKREEVLVLLDMLYQYLDKRIVNISEEYPNRKGKGIRIYLNVKI